MGYETKLILYSENPDGNRLATFLINLTRSVQSEKLRHRMLSFSAASSRAIPTRVMIRRLLSDTYVPQWAKNSKGMAGKFADSEDVEFYNSEWHRAKYEALAQVLRMMTRKPFIANDVMQLDSEEISSMLEQHKNVPHKGDINRLLEPFMFMELIVSGTEWANVFFQRVHTAAHPALQEVVYRMAKLYLTQQPQKLEWGEQHLPFITAADFTEVKSYATKTTDSIPAILRRISTSRCGRVSFGKTDEVKTVEDELNWYHRHIYENAAKGEPPHVSPAEHPAIAQRGKHANYTGFKSFRSTIPNENHTVYTLEDLNRYEEQTGREITTV